MNQQQTPPVQQNTYPQQTAHPPQTLCPPQTVYPPQNAYPPQNPNQQQYPYPQQNPYQQQQYPNTYYQPNVVIRQTPAHNAYNMQPVGLVKDASGNVVFSNAAGVEGIMFPLFILFAIAFLWFPCLTIFFLIYAYTLTTRVVLFNAEKKVVVLQTNRVMTKEVLGSQEFNFSDISGLDLSQGSFIVNGTPTSSINLLFRNGYKLSVCEGPFPLQSSKAEELRQWLGTAMNSSNTQQSQPTLQQTTSTPQQGHPTEHKTTSTPQQPNNEVIVEQTPKEQH